MEYMESKMQDFMEAGFAKEEELPSCASAPDYEECGECLECSTFCDVCCYWSLNEGEGPCGFH